MSRLCVSVCFSPQGSCTMGRIFLDHIGGTRLFSCANCDTILTNRAELISTRFTGATGRAFLFNKVLGTQLPSPFAMGSSRASLELTACSSGDRTDQKDKGCLSVKLVLIILPLQRASLLLTMLADICSKKVIAIMCRTTSSCRNATAGLRCRL